MGQYFVLLTYCASFDIVFDPLFHVRPPVLFLEFPEGFVPARMSCERVIMVEVH